MEITLRILDHVAKRLSDAGGDVSRRALDAFALAGYRDQTLTELKLKTSWDDIMWRYPRSRK